MRGGIILRHQEQQLNTAIEEEINIATRRRSSEIRAHMLAKEASYKDILIFKKTNKEESKKIGKRRELASSRTTTQHCNPIQEEINTAQII